MMARGCTTIGSGERSGDEYDVMSTGVCIGALAGVERSVLT